MPPKSEFRGENPGAHTKRAGEPWFVFFFFSLLYALTASGDLVGDSELRWSVAKRFLDTGWVDLPDGLTFLLAKGNDGKEYSFYGPGQPLLLLPFVIAGRELAPRLPLKLDADRIGQFLASVLLFPSCGAFAVTLVYVIARGISDKRHNARWAALAFGLATMHWQNTVNTYEESQVAICVLAVVWALERFRKSRKLMHLCIAFVGLGVGMAFRMPSLVIIAPIMFVYFIRTLRGGREDRLDAGITPHHPFANWFLAALLGLAPIVVLLGLYNTFRFGVPWEIGYSRAIWDEPDGPHLFGTPLAAGIAGLLLSPGKSVLLYNPILLPALHGWKFLFQTHRTLAHSVLASAIATVVFHAKYTFWGGDLAWGPRYLASSMGLFVLPLIPLIERYGRSKRRLVLGIFACSVVIQLASVVYGFGLEYYQDRRHGTIPDAYVWRPSESQLFCRFQNILLDLAGRPNNDSIPPRQLRPMTHNILTSSESVRRIHVVNFFPFKARAFVGRGVASNILLLSWLIGIVILFWLAMKWRRWVRGTDASPAA